METAVIIACSKSKTEIGGPAQNVYKGCWFTSCLRYVKSLNFDHYYILSGKYGLIEINEYIEPYDEYMMNPQPIEKFPLENVKVYTILFGAYKESISFNHFDIAENIFYPLIKRDGVRKGHGSMLRIMKNEIEANRKVADYDDLTKIDFKKIERTSIVWLNQQKWIKEFGNRVILKNNRYFLTNENLFCYNKIIDENEKLKFLKEHTKKK